jgi:hypothetical protein
MRRLRDFQDGGEPGKNTKMDRLAPGFAPQSSEAIYSKWKHRYIATIIHFPA